MEQMRVLVTAAGSAPAVAVVKALRRMDEAALFVLAVDMSSNAAGLYLAHVGELVPSPSSPHYVDRLLALADRYEINMLVPIFDTETPICAANKDRFACVGAHVAVNSFRCVLDANDKHRSFLVCDAAGIMQPQRFDIPETAPADAFPLIGKPIHGIGTKGMIHLSNKQTPVPQGIAPQDYVWQRRIGGQEYSIDTFGDPHSDLFVAVPRLRRVVRFGQSVQGETCDHTELIVWARRVCQAFGAHDVSCLQVIRTDDGSLHFVEINPRYGSGVSVSIHAGVNFPRLQWLSAYAPELITPELLHFRSGVRMIRYWEELYQ